MRRNAQRDSFRLELLLPSRRVRRTDRPPAHRRSPATAGPEGSTRVAPVPLLSFSTLLLWGAFVALVLLMIAPAAQAQGFGPVSTARQGFWFGGGVGQGHTYMSCGICGGDRETGGMSGYFRAGGTVTPRLLVGGELDGWRRRSGEVGEYFASVAAVGYLYPSAAHGWFLRLGVGYGRYRAAEDDEALVTGLPVLQVGTGYEVRVNQVLSIVPFVSLLATPNGNLNREISSSDGGFRADRVATDLNLYGVSFGIGITRH